MGNVPRRTIYRLGWLVLASASLLLFLLGVPAQVADASRGMMGVWLAIAPQGRLVTLVMPGMPAEQAGIRAGEVVLAINGRPAGGNQPLSTLMGPPRGADATTSTETGPTLAADQPITLTVLGTDGRQREVRLTPRHPTGLPFGLPQRTFARISAALDVLFVLGFLALSTLIVWSLPGRGRTAPNDDRRRDRFAFLAALILLFTALRIPPELYLLIARVPGLDWLGTLLAASGYVVFPLMLGLFPNGRWVPRWLWVYPLFWLVYAVVINAAPGLLHALGPRRGLIDMSVVGLGLLAQAYRYRFASNPVERQQTKWALSGILVAFLLYYGTQELIGAGVITSLFPGLRTSSGATYLYTLFSGQYWLTLLVSPVTMVIAILRYRLWEIDVLIRKTLVYTLITTLLALIYFGTVLVLESLLRLISGTSSALSVVISTLAITLLFSPLRRAVQDLVDRRFYRPRYNAAHTLDNFSSAIRDEVDLERITGEMVRMVDVTVQPTRVEVWMKREIGE